MSTPQPGVFITGKNGYIARHLAARFYKNMKALTTSRHCKEDVDCLSLDLQRPENFDYGRISAGDYVVHLASVSSPDVCANNRDYAWQINVKGTCHFIEECLKRKARVVFFSSDTVYGISEGPFDENSQCFPVGIYGLMKHEVEKEFIGEGRVKIFRLSYVFSREDKFTRYLTKCVTENIPAEIFHPFYRSVVYLHDVLEATVNLYHKWELFTNNIFNICGEEIISRKDIAYFYEKTVSDTLVSKIIKPDESFFKARPKTIWLKSKYFAKLLTRNPTPIQKSMALEFRL